jgi:N6-L-threonylcarbamoyladenine synthase
MRQNTEKNRSPMLLLGIESSCDETAAAVVWAGRSIVSSVIASQIAIHGKYFGVVPELASRAHIENVNIVIEEALEKAKLSLASLRGEIAAIAYTRGPGLAGSLLVGQIAAQTLSSLFDVPLIDVNHLEGHLYAALLENPKLSPPYLSLIVSGGHTELIVVEDFGRYRFLGGTRDDAAGEAFDKVAKLLDLTYPGGPVIDRLARDGDAAAVRFPRPYLKGTWDFSFSGLKTAVVNYVKSSAAQGRKTAVKDICASFQAAVIDTLSSKVFAAAKEYRISTIVVGGGVAANSSLRSALKKQGRREKIKVYLPSLALCTDNAAMIAAAGYYKLNARGFNGSTKNSWKKIEPGMRLENW